MRIRITGGTEAAAELAGLLGQEGYLVTPVRPTHTIHLEEDSALANHFLVDGVDGPLEMRASEHMHQLTAKNFLLDRIGSIRSNRELRVRFHPADSHEIALGVFRGLLDVLPPRGQEQPWWKRIFGK